MTVATELVAVQTYIPKSSISARSILRVTAGDPPTKTKDRTLDENGLLSKRFHATVGLGYPAVALQLIKMESSFLINLSPDGSRTIIGRMS